MEVKILATVGIPVALATLIYSLWSFFNPEASNQYESLLLPVLMIVFLTPAVVLSNRQRQQKSITDSLDITA